MVHILLIVKYTSKLFLCIYAVFTYILQFVLNSCSTKQLQILKTNSNINLKSQTLRICDPAGWIRNQEIWGSTPTGKPLVTARALGKLLILHCLSVYWLALIVSRVCIELFEE